MDAPEPGPEITVEGKIWDSVSTGREIFEGEWSEGDPNTAVTSLISETLESGQVIASSYPHLTHAEKGKRGEHVTSSRLVDDRDPNYLIHQRWSMDNDGKSTPKHDRFFAVDRNTGMVRTATAKFIGAESKVHVPSKLTIPMRGDATGNSDQMKTYFVFTVGTVDDHKHPPLSPRSSRRR